tara:strand:- start:2665 stop:2961 length:297 start_codon:yes stop_codon:yes gene_type:complete
MLKADGFDDAIVGRGNVHGKEDVIIYSAEKCVDVLVKRDGMTDQEALEYCEFNVFQAYLGEGTPIFMWEYTEDEQLPSFATTQLDKQKTNEADVQHKS